jgi:PAS domain S-box-containing protein
MSLTQKTQPGRGQPRNIKRFSLPISVRLSLAFMGIILLTGLIGILAIQQFSLLTNTTTELNSHDLPEAITLVHLRSLLYRQRDLEHSLLNGDSLNRAQSSSPAQQGTLTTENDLQDFSTVVPLNPAGPTPTTNASDAQSKQIQQTWSELAVVLKDIDGDRQHLLAFERPDQRNVNVKDFPLVHKVAGGILKMRTLSERIQALIIHGQFAQARTLDLRQQEPLRLSTIAAVTQLVTIEQAEAANLATQAQQESGRSTLFVFALTALCLLLSIVLAIIITRSLTRPLKWLLDTTEAIAAGDLNVESQAERTDEIGRLASAFDKMRLSLHSTIARLHLERQHTQAIIDATADGVIVIDEAYTIVTCNPAAERLLGWQANEATGKYLWEVLGFKETTVKEAEANEPLSQLLLALQTRSEQFSLEMPLTSRTGQERWLALSCAPMPLPERQAEQHMVIGLHDISQLKAVEQVKSDFVAMVSHELRAPLTTVSGSVEMLNLLDPAADRESYQEVLSILDQQTRRLRQVVEEVLQLTRFDAGRLEICVQPLPIARFLRSVADKVQAEWNSSDHCIIIHEPAEEVLVWADGGLLEIVLRNLFDNARKYTPQGTAIEVETEVSTASGQLQIRVIDHGSGIPEDQLEHIFERFSRGSQSSSHWTRGYGLGLYIARELMLAHNGTIRAEHREHGACFVLSLWLVADDPVSIPMEAEQSHVEG